MTPKSIKEKTTASSTETVFAGELSLADVLLKLGYDSLNPMQERALPLLNEPRLVVSAATASGKTLLALLKIVKNHAETKSKALYIVPLRALAAEKHIEFGKSLAPFGINVGISTGDYDSNSDELSQYDVIIVTSEKLDSLLRHKSKWVGDVGLVIADEVHLLNDDRRGATLEIVLTKLKRTGAALLCLSGTIPNAEEVASWLGAELFKSTWRPTPLVLGVCDRKKIFFETGFVTLAKGEDRAIHDLVELAIAENAGKGQALVFAATRRNAETTALELGETTKKKLTPEEQADCEKLAERALKVLGTPTRQCKLLASCLRNGVSFHHAGIESKQRTLIEDGFKKKRCVKAIVCTTTLAMGVDYPASWVIVRDLKRFNGAFSELIPNLECQQMCLPADAEILLSSGAYAKISDIFEKRGQSGLACVNESNWQMESSVPVNWFKREASEFVKLRLSDGREIRLTPNHPLLKMNEYLGKTLWKTAENIEPGDFIAVVRTAPSNSDLPLTLDYFDDCYVVGAGSLVKESVAKSGLTYKKMACELGVKFKTLKDYAWRKAIPLRILRGLTKRSGLDRELYERVKLIKSKQGNCLSIAKNLSPNFLWLVGIIAAEGSMVRYKGRNRWRNVEYKKIKIGNTDPRIIEKIKVCLRELGISFYEYKRVGGGFSKKEVIMIEICNQALCALISRFGITSGKKAYTVAPSKEVFELPPEYTANYIAGLFDGEGNYNSKKRTHEVRFCVKSRQLVLDTQKLLKKFGVRSTVHGDKQLNWWLTVSSISEVNKFKQKIPCVRLIPDSREYKRETCPRKIVGDLIFEQVRFFEKEILSSPESVYNLTVANNSNYIYNDVLVHNCGRAGRPKFDKRGIGILVCRPTEKRSITEKYVTGPLENVYSKLASEPVLRSHVLALVAQEYCRTNAEIKEFFGDSFYAFQYGDAAELYEKVERVVSELKDMDFLREKQATLLATPVGKRTAELYIDPLSSYSLLRFIEQAGKKKKNVFSYLMALNSTTEALPLMNANRKEEEALWNELYALSDDFDLQAAEFDAAALDKYKTSKVLNAWINEDTEDKILDSFEIPPGVLHARMRNAEWLAYALQELAFMKNASTVQASARMLGRRIKHGIKEELLEICKLRGVGRVRGRRLFNAGVRTIEDFRSRSKEEIKKITAASPSESEIGSEEEE